MCVNFTKCWHFRGFHHEYCAIVSTVARSVCDRRVSHCAIVVCAHSLRALTDTEVGYSYDSRITDSLTHSRDRARTNVVTCSSDVSVVVTHEQRIEGSYIMNQIFTQLLNSMVARIHMLFHGLPGRGKSMMARYLAEQHVAQHGGIIRQLTLPEDTPSSLLAGSFQPTESGSWKWNDGPVTAVLRVGGVLILDEASHCSPDATTFLLAALDGTPTLTLPSGEVISKQPITVIATQNDEPDSLLPALLDRLPIRHRVSEPYTYDFLGSLAALAKCDIENDDQSSLRPWSALRRAIDAGIELTDILPLLFPDRHEELATAIALGAPAFDASMPSESVSTDDESEDPNEPTMECSHCGDDFPIKYSCNHCDRCRGCGCIHSEPRDEFRNRK